MKAFFLSVFVGCWIAAADASAQEREEDFHYASERSGGSSSVIIDSLPWQIRVDLERVWRENRSFEQVVHVAVRQSSGQTMEPSNDDIILSVSGINADCSNPQILRDFDRTAQVHFTFRCHPMVWGPSYNDRVWDFNQPLSLSMRNMHHPTRPFRSWPIGYLRYTGWPLSWSADDWGTLAMLMATHHLPGLSSVVDGIRRDAERRLGHMINDSAESRYALAEAIVRFTISNGLEYANGGDAYHGRWPSLGTTNFPAETLAYGRGACDDFTVLAAYFLSSLHAPFAIFSAHTHVASAVELARWLPSERRPVFSEYLSRYAIEYECEGARCLYLPLDLSLVAREKDTISFFAEGARLWSAGLFTNLFGGVAVVLSSRRRGLVQPSETLLGRSWLGSSSEARVIPPRFRF